MHCKEDNVNISSCSQLFTHRTSTRRHSKQCRPSWHYATHKDFLPRHREALKHVECRLSPQVSTRLGPLHLCCQSVSWLFLGWLWAIYPEALADQRTSKITEIIQHGCDDQIGKVKAGNVYFSHFSNTSYQCYIKPVYNKKNHVSCKICIHETSFAEKGCIHIYHRN